MWSSSPKKFKIFFKGNTFVRCLSLLGRLIGIWTKVFGKHIGDSMKLVECGTVDSSCSVLDTSFHPWLRTPENCLWVNTRECPTQRKYTLNPTVPVLFFCGRFMSYVSYVWRKLSFCFHVWLSSRTTLRQGNSKVNPCTPLRRARHLLENFRSPKRWWNRRKSFAIGRQELTLTWPMAKL